MKQQIIPLALTGAVCIVLIFTLFTSIQFLNLLPIRDKIIPLLRIPDIVVGLTIYLKTSVDFALFIGSLMSKYQGVRNRIAIEIGTALGNGFGTLFVLIIWTFFKEVPFLMVVMIFIAALVLLQLAEEGLKTFTSKYTTYVLAQTLTFLQKFNSLFSPLLSFFIPQQNIHDNSKKNFLSLFLFSLTIPLLLGLDDFAGYIPLFNIVNVFGFAVGIFLGHMMLNLALFASPKITIRIVEQPVVELLGSFAFIGIALWGFVEVATLILKIF